MRTHKHYLDMLSRNPETSIGFTLAAQAVYAAKLGVFDVNAPDHDEIEYREIALSLREKYGESLSVDEVRREMAAYHGFTSVIIRRVPSELRREFKARCAREGTSQQDKIIELMREYIAK